MKRVKIEWIEQHNLHRQFTRNITSYRMIDHHACLSLNNYRIRDASSRTIFSATYTASIFQTKRYCSGNRPHSIPCPARGHLIHTEFRRRDHPRLACQVTRLHYAFLKFRRRADSLKGNGVRWQEKSGGFGKMAVR